MITFETGLDRVGLLRLTPRGLMRWYATCCGAPLFNTLASRRQKAAGVAVARLDDPGRLPPARIRLFRRDAAGKVRTEGGGRMAAGIFTRMAAAALSGRWRDNPFFDKAGRPIAPARIPAPDERAALRDHAGD